MVSKCDQWQCGKDKCKTVPWVSMIVGCHGSADEHIGLSRRGDLYEAIMANVWTHVRVGLMVERADWLAQQRRTRWEFINSN